MNEFDDELNRRLDALREQGLYRELRRVDSSQSPHLEIAGQPLLNFSSNDYLGLANEPALKEAAIRAVEKFGAGAGASRLICGSLAPHHQLEETLADFKGAEAALTFSSGYAAALGTIGALLGNDDIIIIDRLVHACIVDAARLCGAKLRVFAHNDLNDLAKILKWADRRSTAASSASAAGESEIANRPSSASALLRRTDKSQSRPRKLIVTESVFSMDGDHAPLRELVELKDRFGAWLMVDEAHATGLYGAQRRGLLEAAGVSGRVEIQMGTLGKALGAAGGYVCGSRPLVDYLVNRARSFIFSTAPVPAAAATATAGIHFVQSSDGEARRNLLWDRVDEILQGLPEVAQWGNTASKPASKIPERSAIIPLLVGKETEAVRLAAGLRTRGVFVPAIRFPTVARGEARLRLTVSAAHTRNDVAQLLATLLAALGALPVSVSDI